MSKKIKTKREYRSAVIQSGKINEENRTVDISFSSEQPVNRWYGNEILGHKSSEVDLTRLNDSAAVLVDHHGDQVGVVEKAQVKLKKGLAQIRFGAGVRASEVFKDIVDGIRKNVSVGYAVREMKLVEEKDKKQTFRATLWEPLELSIVSVPADQTVGVGRSEKEEYETKVPDEFKTKKKKAKPKKPNAKPEKKPTTRSKKKKDKEKKDTKSLAIARKKRLSLAKRS